MNKPTLWAIFTNYMLIGLKGWGGPVAQIQVIHEDAVEKKGWLDNDTFREAYAVCSMIPGPEAAELCMYVGYYQRKAWGGILAGLGFMLPNFLLITLLSWMYFQYTRSSNFIHYILFGVKPAMIAIVAYSLYRLANKFGVLHNRKMLFISCLMLVSGLLIKVDLVLLLLAMGFVYLLLNRDDAPGDGRDTSGGSEGKSGHNGGSNSGNKNMGSANLAVSLHLASSSVSAWISTWAAGKLVSLSWLFFKIGALSFGGAYTVLALLQFEAVDHYGWLTTNEYIDGLAINELTPGPLIMVAAFVGFAANGWWGAALATFFIFLPAFLLIVVGAPYFEKIRKNRRLKIYLAGVSAAVVGLTAYFLITLSLGVFRDWVSPIVALICLFLLIRLKWPLWAVFACGIVLGLGALWLELVK
ncbi:MAG TPA: chromate efflux transporter [Bacilli bacterium]